MHWYVTIINICTVRIIKDLLFIFFMSIFLLLYMKDSYVHTLHLCIGEYPTFGNASSSLLEVGFLWE